MSLLEAAMETCYMLDRSTASDGYGGYTASWTRGAAIQAAIVYDTSLQARVAAVQGVTSLYTITTKKNVNLQFHDVLVRASDSKVFRVTTKGDDNKTPESASLNMRQVNAEEWATDWTVPDND